MIKTISYENLPKKFPTLVKQFIGSAIETPAKEETIDEHVQRLFSQKYPLLDPEAFTVQRTYPINPSNIKGSDEETSLRDEIKKELAGDPDYQYKETMAVIRACNNFNPKIKTTTPKHIKLTLPLFAYTTKKTWHSKGFASHEFPWSLSFNCKSDEFVDGVYVLQLKWFGIDDWLDDARVVCEKGDSYSKGEIKGTYVFRRKINISTPTPIAPDIVTEAIPNAISDYYQTWATAISKYNIKTTPEMPSPKVGVLWVPSLESLSLEMETPIVKDVKYIDPALILDIGKNKYVVALWDIQNEQPLDGFLSEWVKKGNMNKIK